MGNPIAGVFQLSQPVHRLDHSALFGAVCDIEQGAYFIHFELIHRAKDPFGDQVNHPRAKRLVNASIRANTSSVAGGPVDTNSEQAFAEYCR